MFYEQRFSSFLGEEGWGDGELIPDSGEAECETPYQGIMASWGMGKHHCLGQMLWDIRNNFFKRENTLSSGKRLGSAEQS